MLIGRAWPKRVPNLDQFLRGADPQQKPVVIILVDRHIKFAQVGHPSLCDVTDPSSHRVEVVSGIGFFLIE